MKLSKNLHWFLYALFILSCARQSAPTGGPKDTIPPTLVKAKPVQDAVNFKGREIELEFSEMIDLNNAKDQLIITPSVGKNFDVKTKKNTVNVEFKNQLDSNTTYTLNFREAVRDITEKNPARNLKVSFSTGSYIDSLSISGSTVDILQAKDLEEITVALYPKNDTFNIYKHPAPYFTKTSKTGKFELDHLKPALYYIYAFNDKNKNLFIDSKSEAYGFKAEPLNLNQDTTNINLGLVKLDARPLKITSGRPYNTYFNLRLTKSLKNATITAEDKSDVYYTYGDDQSNIKIFNTIGERDSLQVNLKGIDSIANTIDTLIYLKFIKRDVTPEKFEGQLNDATIQAETGKLVAEFQFTKPVKEINPDSLFLRIDSITTIPITDKDITYVELTRKLTIQKILGKNLFYINPALEPTEEKQRTRKSNPELYSGLGAFISIENDSTKRITKQITPFQPDKQSSLIFEVETTAPNFIVQLLDTKSNVLQEISNLKKGEFKGLSAGDYQVRVFIDGNNNKTWDAGNYFRKQEPEKMTYSKNQKGQTTVSLKESWDLEVPKMFITP